MNTRDIQIILKISQYRSITRTAEDFHMTQPAISNTLKRCEDELGFSLFTRQGKWLILNEQGKIFCQASEAMLKDLANVQSGLTLSPDLRHEIIIDLYAESDKLYRLLGEFTDQNPDIRVILHSRQTYVNTFSMADFSVTMREDLQEGEEHLPLESRGALYVMLPKSHPKAYAGKLNLEELRDEMFIFRRETDRLEQTYRVCTTVGMRPKVAMVTETNTAKYSAIRRGIGIGLIFEHELSLAPMIHGCRLLPVIAPLHMEWLYLSWNKERLSERGQRLITYMKERI